jgi:hypothetical protein
VEWNDDLDMAPSVAKEQRRHHVGGKAKEEAPQPGIEPETFRLLGR